MFNHPSSSEAPFTNDQSSEIPSLRELVETHIVLNFQHLSEEVISDQESLLSLPLNELMNLLSLPEQLTVDGGSGGCFFQALAQVLNDIEGKHSYTEKSLRLACHEFYIHNEQQVDKLIYENDHDMSIGTAYDRVQYTKHEVYESLQGISPLWGRAQVEGVILCNQLKIPCIYFIKLTINPVNYQPMAIHYLITADGMRPVENEDISSYAEATPILIEEGGTLQFVPVLSKYNVPKVTAQPDLAKERISLRNEIKDEETTKNTRISNSTPSNLIIRSIKKIPTELTGLLRERRILQLSIKETIITGITRFELADLLTLNVSAFDLNGSYSTALVKTLEKLLLPHLSSLLARVSEDEMKLVKVKISCLAAYCGSINILEKLWQDSSEVYNELLVHENGLILEAAAQAPSATSLAWIKSKLADKPHLLQACFEMWLPLDLIQHFVLTGHVKTLKWLLEWTGANTGEQWSKSLASSTYLEAWVSTARAGYTFILKLLWEQATNSQRIMIVKYHSRLRQTQTTFFATCINSLIDSLLEQEPKDQHDEVEEQHNSIQVLSEAYASLTDESILNEKTKHRVGNFEPKLLPVDDEPPESISNSWHPALFLRSVTVTELTVKTVKSCLYALLPYQYEKLLPAAADHVNQLLKTLEAAPSETSNHDLQATSLALIRSIIEAIANDETTNSRELIKKLTDLAESISKDDDLKSSLQCFFDEISFFNFSNISDDPEALPPDDDQPSTSSGPRRG